MDVSAGAHDVRIDRAEAAQLSDRDPEMYPNVTCSIVPFGKGVLVRKICRVNPAFQCKSVAGAHVQAGGGCNGDVITNTVETEGLVHLSRSKTGPILQYSRIRPSDISRIPFG